jgi:YD repeat-containing protein
VTTFIWNSSMRRELAEQDAFGNYSTFSYDAAGNRIASQDPLGNITSFTFDVPVRILIAFVAKLMLYGFCHSGSRFPELSRILEKPGATGLGGSPGVSRNVAIGPANQRSACLRRGWRLLFGQPGLVSF